MTYKYIAFDLDGTALRTDLSVSRRLVDACRKAEEKGIIVSISSGRIFRSTKRYSDMLDIHGPTINCQGAVVTNTVDGSTLYSRPLEKDMVYEIVPFLKEESLFPQAMTNMDFYYEFESEWSRSYAKKQTFDGILVEDLRKDLPEMPLKIIGMGEPEKVYDSYLSAKERFGERLEVAISVPTMLEITHPQATKGNAMDWICANYGITPQEMIAVGDSINDTTMIQYAGLGAVMENGRDEVKAIADIIVPSNDDDGVAWVIEKYLL